MVLLKIGSINYRKVSSKKDEDILMNILANDERLYHVTLSKTDDDTWKIVELVKRE